MTDGLTERGRCRNSRMVATVFGIIVAFGFLMEKIGFVATVLIVAASCGWYSASAPAVLVAGMAIGMAVGCWVVFGQMLGAYLPPAPGSPCFDRSALDSGE